MSGTMPHDWREIDIETVERHMTKDLISRADAIAKIRQQSGEGDESWMKGNNSAIAACAATIRALPAYEVAVRELVWVDRGAGVHPRFKATAEFEVYYVDRNKAGLFDWWSSARKGKTESKTLEAAKAAAQSDYTARIRSALTATPSADVAGLVDAATDVIANVNQPDATWDLPFRTVRRLTVALASMKEAKE